LAAQFVVFAEQLGVVLFELADTQGRWWQRGDLFWGERECGLELGHGLLELFDVGFSLGAMSRLCLCISTTLWTVGGGC
jgi:hypothetical protein